MFKQIFQIYKLNINLYNKLPTGIMQICKTQNSWNMDQLKNLNFYSNFYSIYDGEKGNMN